MRWWWADHSELGERRPKFKIPKWSEPASRCDADMVRAHASKRDSDREVTPNLGEAGSTKATKSSGEAVDANRMRVRTSRGMHLVGSGPQEAVWGCDETCAIINRDSNGGGTAGGAFGAGTSGGHTGCGERGRGDEGGGGVGGGGEGGGGDGAGGEGGGPEGGWWNTRTLTWRMSVKSESSTGWDGAAA
eukprot:7376302-Prymnesium_polylepis.2